MSSTRAGQINADMSQEILAAHNNYRAEVTTPPLQWSDSIGPECSTVGRSPGFNSANGT